MKIIYLACTLHSMLHLGHALYQICRTTYPRVLSPLIVLGYTEDLDPITHRELGQLKLNNGIGANGAINVNMTLFGKHDENNRLVIRRLEFIEHRYMKCHSARSDANGDRLQLQLVHGLQMLLLEQANARRFRP